MYVKKFNGGGGGGGGGAIEGNELRVCNSLYHAMYVMHKIV